MLKPCRIWIKESGGSLYTPPDLLLPSFTKLGSEELEVKLAKHPLVSALFRRHRWQVTPEYRDYAVLEARISGDRGHLSLPGNASKYDIEIQRSGDAIAYYFPQPSKSALTIEVVERISGDSQVVIGENGTIKVSANLSGQTIKVRTLVVYRQATQELPDPINRLDAHLLFKSGEFQDRRWKYLELKDCEFEPVFGNKLRLINWQNSREEWL